MVAVDKRMKKRMKKQHFRKLQYRLNSEETAKYLTGRKDEMDSRNGTEQKKKAVCLNEKAADIVGSHQFPPLVSRPKFRLQNAESLKRKNVLLEREYSQKDLTMRNERRGANSSKESSERGEEKGMGGGKKVFEKRTEQSKGSI